MRLYFVYTQTNYKLVHYECIFIPIPVSECK